MTDKLKKYIVEIDGRGFEIFAGHLTKEQYEYWSNQDEFELSDAFTGLPDEDKVPEDARLPHYYNDLPEIENEYGPVVEDCRIIVQGLDDKTDFISELSNIELNNKNYKPINIHNNLQPGHYVKIEIGNKGSFFAAEFEAESFDPKKLAIEYTEIHGMGLATGIFYDGHELDDTGSCSNYGKYFEVDLFEVCSPLEDMLEVAKVLYKKGDVSGAITSLNENISNNLGSRLFPEVDLLRAQRQLAIYTMRSLNYKKADFLFKKNLSNWEKLEGVYSKDYAMTSGYYAANLIELGKYSAAITYGQRYLASHSGAYHWHNLALALENSERYQEAESAYHRAIEASDEQDDYKMKIHSLHGLYHVRIIDRKRRAVAFETLNEAIEIAREHKDAESLKMLYAELKRRKR